MNKGGRKRIPEHLKIVRGTDRPDRTNADAPTPEVSRPPMPETLTDNAKENWDRFCGVLERMGGRLAHADCQARYDALRQAVGE